MKKILYIFFLIFITFLFAESPNWQIISGTQYSMVLIAEISTQEGSFVGGNDNLFAAFGPNGDEDCRGIGLWIDSGYWYMTLVGNTNNEQIHFKIYDSTLDEIIPIAQTMNFSDNLTIGTPSSPFQLSADILSISGTVNLINSASGNANLNEVIINVNGNTYHPSANGSFEIPVESGTQNISINCDGYQSITDSFDVYDTSIENLNYNLIDWIPISGTQYSMVLMTVIESQSINNQMANGNILAAFGPNGYSDCRGIASWEAENPPYWDGYWYLTIVGDINNEDISFAFFEENSSSIIDFPQSVEFLNNTTIGEPDSPYILLDYKIQTFNLMQNWNWISFNVNIENPNTSDVFNSLGNNIFQVKSQNQSATYYENANIWVGDLTTIDVNKGYLIKMNEAFNGFSVSGTPVETNTDLQLNTGWNWVPYFPSNNLLIENALSTITNNVIQVKSQTQSANYYNPPGTWVGDLDELSEGNSYKINVNNSCILNYDGETRTNPITQNRDCPDWTQITGTEYSCVLVFRVNDNEGNPYTEEDVVASFGEDETCRGIAVYQDAIPGVWDGYWYMTIVGNTENEEISFKVYDSSSDTVEDCIETIDFISNETFGTPSEPIILNVNTIANHSDVNSIITGFTAYPNPFKISNTRNNFTIKYSLSEKSKVDFEIFNIRGQRLFNKEISDAKRGENIFEWNCKSNDEKTLPNGIYLIKMNTNKDSYSQKIILLK